MKPIAWIAGLLMIVNAAGAQVLDKQKLLDAQTFWDNRDWDWYKQNIPFFDCPDAQINTTYYYRWELLTKHLTYGSANTGYLFTEFIDRPFWSGKYGAISCPAGHQLYEARWLRDPRVARDYSRYWFKTEGAQPRNYSTWLADAIWAVHEAHPDQAMLRELLPDLVKNYQGWEKRHFVPEVGLFWQTGHDDGMEFNINSRQTKDILRGAPGYRPTMNAYMWADATAIAKVAQLAGDEKLAKEYQSKAASIKERMQKLCWDDKRQFYLHVFKQDEEKDGHKVKALLRTYETGKFAGGDRGREQIGYVPWQFNMPDAGYESAWKFLMDPDYFHSDFGPRSVEKNDPMYVLMKNCCYWSGQSWPYATTQTLKGLANLLQNYKQNVVSRADYFRVLQIYTRTHQKNGKPYIAEAAHPDNGSWEGHDGYNHSEHYFHSGYVDLIITGLVGLKTRADDVIEIDPLAPVEWDYFALDDLMYHGRKVSIIWDAKGDRYTHGKGLHILVDGKKIASADKLQKLSAALPNVEKVADSKPARGVNFAVNNDGTYFPRVMASHTGPKSSVMKLIDGNHWYHIDPPNRWTCEGSTAGSDWVTIDFGLPRPIHTIKLYVLDDDKNIIAPVSIELESWDGKSWVRIPGQKRTPESPQGHRANVVTFAEIKTERIRAVLKHAPNGKSGLSEIEVWGDATGQVEPAGPPKGNLAYNDGKSEFPKMSASFTSPFDKTQLANDGIVNFNANPNNRWTSYQSPNSTDWLAVDFGAEKEMARVELGLYDDRGGVQAPASYVIQVLSGKDWVEVANPQHAPQKPAGGQFNTVKFEKVRARQIRVLCTHAGKARSGITEIMVWPD